MENVFGQRVRDLRIAAGFRSTRKLAAAIGMSQPALRAVENGDTDPDEIKVGNFMKLVKELNTTPGYLYRGVSDAEEAEAASLYRQLDPRLRDVWLTTGRVFALSTPNAKPSRDRPYTKALIR